MGTENEIGIAMPPVENDVSGSSRIEIKVLKEWCHLPNCRHNPAIYLFPVGLERIQYRRQIRCIGHEPAIVADITILSNPRSRRCVVEVIDATMVQQISEHICRWFAFFCRIPNPRFLVTTPQRHGFLVSGKPVI